MIWKYLPERRQWCRENDVHLLWTPTNASWLNPIERQFTPIEEFVMQYSDYASHHVSA